MSLLDEARKKAAAEAKQQDEAADATKRTYEWLEKLLEAMKVKVVAELHALHDQPSKHGKFEVRFVEDHYHCFAYLTVESRMVAWFKAKVVSGTFDGSDDCRDIPYTEPRVWARFYPPYPSRETHDGTWDLNERRYYHNGGWTEGCRAVGDLPKFFEKMTNWLSRWM